MNIPTNHADYMKLSPAERELVPADRRCWLEDPGYDESKAQIVCHDDAGNLYYIDADTFAHAIASNE
jgi:hypothetical protein